jgi:hypothetical protein
MFGSANRRPREMASRNIASRGGRIWLGVRPDDQHPAMLGGVLPAFGEDRECPGQPSVLHCPIADHIAGDPCQDARHSGRCKGLTLPAEGGVRAFVLSDCRGVVTLQVKRLTKSFSRAAGLGLSQSILECVASVAASTGCRAAQASSIMDALIKSDDRMQALNRYRDESVLTEAR